MKWTPNNKAEQIFVEAFQTKTEMARQIGVTRTTLDAYLNCPSKLNSKIKKIAKLTRHSELTLFKAINT